MVKAKKVRRAAEAGTPGTGPGNTNQGLRNRGRRWAFTWNNYPDNAIERLQHWLAVKATKAVVGKEIGGETQTAHLQGYFEAKNPLDFNALKAFDNAVHWEKAIGSAEQNYVYCTKENDFVTVGSWPQQVKDPLQGKELRPWQAELEAYLSNEPHPRHIVWYYDPVGNTGKTTWTKHWCLKHDDAILVEGKADDIKCALALLKKNGKPLPKTILWDIPRAQEHISYTAMEKIKDGCFFSGKYESGMVLMDQPHIIVFSNNLPDTSKLSQDRWDIRTLSALTF